MEAIWTKEQERVIESRGKNLLVSAAAGSGKTAVLVERIIQRITRKEDPVDIDRMLVVTFTKAAAREMKEKIRDAIDRRLSEEPENPHLLRQLTLLGEAKIQTIDSFCLSVIREHFHTIDLDPDFRTGDEGEMELLRQEVLEQLLDDCFEEGREAFLALADIYVHKGRTGPLTELILKLYYFAMSFPFPKEWLKEGLSAYEIETKEELFQAGWMKEYEGQIRTEISDLYLACERLLCETEKHRDTEAVAALLRSDLSYLEELLSTKDWDSLLQVAGGWKEGFRTFPRKRKEDPDPEFTEAVKIRRTDLKDRLTKSGSGLLHRISSFPGEVILRTLSLSRPVAEELVRLTLAFMDAYEAEKRRKNLLDFSDQEHLALAILLRGESHEPSEIALEYRQRFCEVMVDEYQDSNYVQEMMDTRPTFSWWEM